MAFKMGAIAKDGIKNTQAKLVNLA